MILVIHFLTSCIYIQPTLGPDGKKKEPESNVLLASIENMQYAVTVDVLHTVNILFGTYWYFILSRAFSSVLMGTCQFQVFSAFGTVQKIAIFEKNGGMQALIQYPGKARMRWILRLVD